MTSYQLVTLFSFPANQPLLPREKESGLKGEGYPYPQGGRGARFSK